ncbi:succinylglutamate desuccinylase/aspartoacylase family protein [Parvularcula lutaonensis]|uniref:Succinylglutamate desuccinylase/aspartoacylase family protein n=1 Tax=Parvularcula lutaonensis TaxID=491923 RepID=A0ABV7MBW0_9PROT|nr:succinylglutamate desuccinylase/aspartoacylase family protein [Parvularcula lutaonensis]GGY49414.1 hypothetical protein GCM10007148_17410 [Parvularcula lutaonensis]
MIEIVEREQLSDCVTRELVKLPPAGSRTYAPIEIFRFGTPGARPKAYLQAGLHADELPGMLVLRKLRETLADHAGRGEILGEIVLIPVCNPIGLSQVKGGYLVGRVEQETDRNFNRGFPDLCALVKEKVEGKLGDDPVANVDTIRHAMRKKTAKLEPDGAFGTMQQLLIHEACDADIVLDVHADNEALLHLYTGLANWPDAEDLAAELDARAVLLSDESGGEPFDEACGYAWVKLQKAFPDVPIPQGCLSATVELRSNNHVTHEDSDRDMRALTRFLMRRGLIKGEAGSLPRLLCEATPLRAMQQLRAPAEGLVVYRARLGDTVRKGDILAEIVPPKGGEPAFVEAVTDGILFARHDQRWAWENKVIGKVAGSALLEERKGNLLTD